MTPETTIAIASPPFFVTLIAGLMIAFAFQLLLTNFGIAAGITALGYLPETTESQSDGLGSAVGKVGFVVGFGTLLTVNTVLFIACFLAVKISLVSNLVLGAILGIAIWSAYFLILVWVGSIAVSSLVGSVVSTVTSGVQGLMAIVATVFGRKAKIRSEPTPEIAPETTATVIRQELGAAASDIQETIKGYLQSLQPPQLDLKEIRREFESLLREPELRAIADNGLLKADRQALVHLISNRTDLSKQDIAQIVDQMEVVWHQVLGRQGQTELLNFLKSAQPDNLTTAELNTRLRQLLGDEQQDSHDAIGEEDTAPRSVGLINRAQQIDFKALLKTVMTRVDLADLDVERVLSQIQSFKQSLTQVDETPDRSPSPPFSSIKADVENYLLNSYPWHLTQKTVKVEFKDVIFDPEAAPDLIHQQLEPLNRDYFTHVLNQRDDLTSAKVAKIADRLEEVRQDVLATLTAAIAQERSKALEQHLEQHLRTVKKSRLKPATIQRDVRALLEAQPSFEQSIDRLRQLSHDVFVQPLRDRQDLSQAEVKRLAVEFATVGDRLLTETKDLQERAKSEAEALWYKLESYLRDTSKKLTATNIKRELQSFLKEAKNTLVALQPHLPQFDRDTIQQILEERQDLNQKRIEQVIEQLERAWNGVLKVPQKAVARAKDGYNQATAAIGEYLQTTDWSNLDPEGMKQDLPKLLTAPHVEGASALSQLAQVDWEVLAESLKREDLTEEQINAVIRQAQTVVRDLVKIPRRLAVRTQATWQNFQPNLAEYLRNTDKEELNPEGIKRDLQLLLRDPQLGLEHLGDRLSQFDRSTLITLLAQRQDLTEAEANQIVEQIESVRDQFVEQVHSVQHRVQSITEQIFAKLRGYLDSLQLPELNYNQIQQDIQTLLDAPQAGFEALGDRLGQVNRDMLATLLSLRDDISESVAGRVIDQIEQVRTGMMQQVDRLQQEAQRQVEDLKRQAQQQAEETRKAIATAAWWLFSIAFTSMITSAIAGALATRLLQNIG